MANAKRNLSKDADSKYSIFSSAHGYFNRNTGMWEKDEDKVPAVVTTQAIFDWKLLLLCFLVGILLGMKV